MKRNKIALQIFSFILIFSSFIACDKDFATLETDIINSDIATNFDNNNATYDVITYTKTLGPVQTDNMTLSTLGIYDDAYGRTNSSFVTQLATSTYDPSFGGEDFQQIDSVVLTIPYFSSIMDVDDDSNITYNVDSIIPEPNGTLYKSIKLRIFENNYFIRDFDPNGDFDDAQAYFSNKSASNSENISALEGQELNFIASPETSYTSDNDNEIIISNEGFVLKEEDDEGVLQVSERIAPSLRLKLDPDFWQNKIIDKEGEPVLSNQNNFLDYFRGLYFKAEPINNDGSFLFLNTSSQNANVTIYYKRLTPSTTDGVDDTQQNTLVLTFGPNRINFIDNDFDIIISDPNPNEGESRIYLKGGEGSVGRIKLFNGENEDDDPEINAFENFRSQFVITEDGKFVRSKRLVNEANLVFYVDQNAINGGEPDRIYLYDVGNKAPLVDYFLDGVNNSLPSLSIANHLVPLQRVDGEPDGAGIKYKLRLTEHINNLLIRDSTNVELGLSVSLNVNLEQSLLQRETLTTTDTNLMIPTSSVLSPRGTVLHGNNTEDLSKKVYLEIFYTCLEEDDCEEN